MGSLADTYQEAYSAKAAQYAKAAGVPTELYGSVIQNESGWNPWAVGSKGEIGFAQLMPATAKGLGVNAWNPNENLKGGADLLGSLYSKFGNWRDALAAYNAGPGNLKAGYGYADKILGSIADPFGGHSNMPGDTGDAKLDTQFATESAASTNWLLSKLQGLAGTAGFVVLAVALIAFGIWAIINSAKAKT